jgi:tRNA(Arg) A34 adenosine deaminase TadA
MVATDLALSAHDAALLRAAIALSARSRDEGNHPFATIVADASGTMLAQATNAHSVDCTCHAEMNAVRIVSAKMSAQLLRRATLYSSAEPCAMCAGGIYWSGIGRVVYALSESRLLAITGNHPENPTLALPCRDVFRRGQRPIEVIGPRLEDEAAAVHVGFWSAR